MASGKHILIIGGGPAGLRAAEVAASAGARVTLCDQKPSFGRKFLVAGKGGLNLTHSEPIENFPARYQGGRMPQDFWEKTLSDFDNHSVRKWAAELGIDTFAASSGRIYPKSLKGAPMLRAWLSRLDELGVVGKTRHYLTGLDGTTACFETPSGEISIAADAIILAMGGASWPRTGSDGRWVKLLEAAGIEVAELVSANCGWEVAWPESSIELLEGVPLKNLHAFAADSSPAVGEVMLTKYGIEGGPIYGLGPALRAMPSPVLTLDLKPAHSVEQLTRKAESVKRDLVPQCLSRWRLQPAVGEILKSVAPGQLDSVTSIAAQVKSLQIPLTQSRPIAESISSAGGVAWNELNDSLMIQNLPGVFVAGEMIDWEAPTGGYLLQGCFASGQLAAVAALGWQG